ncbi:expressed unknown protein [Seminavis robusta]|uniref:Uncharacterized protein n=1 Tax=Seminavis robusta TaxID=568900 RepID=A0A9N8HJC4_9STRA|nr:expressed unknown protein [Seminavis robusta]|eukprot:Sro652_g181760.1 n/a (618) ;mRNA; r:19959-21812
MESFMTTGGDTSAEAILQNVFRRAHHEDPKTGGIELAVGLLLQHPKLARKTYLTKRAPTARYPLFILAQSGASLAQVKSVFALYSSEEHKEKLQSVHQGSHSRILPKPELMQVMEGGKASFDVLSFLVENCPGLLTHNDAIGGLAVHKFFRRWGYGFYRVEGSQKCDNLAFSMIQKCPACCDFDLFWLALQVESSDKIVDMIVEQLLKRGDIDSLEYKGTALGPARSGFDLSVRDVKAITKLLEKAETFSFDPFPGALTPDTFRSLMNGIMDAKTLRQVSLSLDGQFLETHDAARTHFRRALANSSFEEFKLFLPVFGSTADAMVHDMVAAFRFRNKPLVSLTLENGHFTSMNSLMRLISSDCTRSLVFRSVGLPQHAHTGTNTPAPDNQCLESFEMVGGYLTPATDTDTTAALIRCLGAIPSLERLVFQRPKESLSEDATDLVADLLRRSQNLKELDLPLDMRVDVSSICEVLKDNNTLRSFSCWPVVGHEEAQARSRSQTVKVNTTLIRFDCYGLGCRDGRDSFTETDYHLYLNRFGKRQARDPETSKATFVKLLDGVSNDKSFLHRFIVAAEHSVLYGLLRENPTVWLAQGHAKRPLERSFHPNSPAPKKRRIA